MRFRYSSTTPTRGDLLLEDRLLDLRDRRFLNLEALAPLRKQRHRADHEGEKSCCNEVPRRFMVCGLIRSRCESGQRSSSWQRVLSPLARRPCYADGNGHTHWIHRTGDHGLTDGPETS